MDATFADKFVDTHNGSQFVGSVEVTLRDLETDNIYIKQLTEQDLSDITGVDRGFSPLELIRIAEYIRQFSQPVSMFVKEGSQIVTNDMIVANAIATLNGEEPVAVEPMKAKPVAKPKKTSPPTKPTTSFGFDPKKANQSLANRKRKPEEST